MTPLLAVSIGCPSGVGPEVSVRAAADAARRGVCALLVGDAGVLARAAEIVGVARRRLVVVASAAEARALTRGQLAVLAPTPALDLRDAAPGTPSAAGGRAQLAWIDAAASLVQAGAAQALVTGPVSKEAIARSGGGPAARRFLGHTEHLARSLGAREVVMAFWSERLTISLVTTHLPIRAVPRAITPEAVSMAAFHTARLLARLTDRAPRLAVAALNPHAGEGGLLGGEEERAIAPGIALARRRLARARCAATLVGPVGAESAVRQAHAGGYDGVVAMYHDQATIPMKLIGFGEAVNVTLGLPIVRTSVDHGTGYDRAGKGTADASGMAAAIELARRLVTG